MSETAPERAWLNMDGNSQTWLSGPNANHRVEYILKSIHDISQTERHADGEYIGHLQARVAELEAALRRIDRALTYPVCTSIQARGYDVWSISKERAEFMAEIARAALTPPEQQ